MVISSELQHRAEDAARAEDEVIDAGPPEEELPVQPGAVLRSNGNHVDPGGPESVAARKAEIQEKRRAAYSTATTRLREENREKFDTLMVEECHKRGVEWEPRPNDESRALTAVQELLHKYPHLKDRVASFLTE